MKYPPGLDVTVFEDDDGWWRIRWRRNLTGRSKDEIDYWLGEIGEESIPPPVVMAARYDTDHEAHIAALEHYIDEFGDWQYDPAITVEVLDPDDDTDRLRDLRKEAASA